MGAGALVVIFGVGAALLGFWLTARFPRLGPQSFRAALLAMVAVFLLQSPIPLLVPRAVDAVGIPFALIGLILPSLTVLFWSAGCLVRSVAAAGAAYRP